MKPLNKDLNLIEIKDKRSIEVRMVKLKEQLENAKKIKEKEELI
jgi:hypothetical protein